MSQEKLLNLTDFIVKIDYSYSENSVFENLYFTEGTAKFSESGKNTKAGIVYEQRLSLFYPCAKDATIASEFENKRFKLKLTYSSSDTITFDTDSYFECELNFVSERIKSGYDISFNRLSLSPSAYD